jgi:Eukaryotic aspartyl protease
MKAGSTRLWVPSSVCTDPEMNKYDVSKSSTGSLKSGPVSIDYLGGHQVSGSVYTDTGESSYLC